MTMKYKAFWSLVTTILVWIAADFAAAQAHLLFTADTQGHVGSCQSCPGEPGLGGLSRRQTLLTQLRQRESGLLLLDAGSALFGEQSVPSGGKVIAAAYSAMGYDVVNVSYRDFRLGKAATLTALEGAKFAPVSANVLDDATGKPLFQPFIVKRVGNERLAIVGATEFPSALAILPELRQQLAGLKILPPADALAAVLPQARAQADRVVLLFYGSAASLASIRGQARSIDLILLGGAEPGEIPENTKPAVVGTFPHGRYVADVSLVPGQAPGVTQNPVGGNLQADPGLEKLLATYQAPPISLSVTPPGPSSDNTRGVARIESGKAERLNLSARNQAVELKVSSVALVDRLGDAAAPEGKQFLVIDAQLRNIQPPERVEGQLTPAQYQVPNLADNLYAVADESRILHRSEIDAGGLLPFNQIHLEKQNDVASGKIVYEVSRGAPLDVKLRFYDFAHGHIVIPILAGSLGRQAAVLPPQHNSVVEAAVYRVEKLPKTGDQSAPPGQLFVRVDLRGRSTLITKAAASGFDFHAARGSMLDIGTVCDWKESRKYIQLVVDGEHSYLPLPQSDLPEEPRFLPDVMTGGSLTFLVPQKYQSIELRCDFPNASLPGGSVQRPQGLTFAIEGTRPALPSRPAIAGAKDEVFDVSVVGQKTAGQFAGTRAQERKRFLVLDVTVRNTGSGQEFFQTRQQLKYVSESAEQVEFDDATLHGVYAPSELMYIPSGERRTFQLAYQIGIDQTRPRLAYAAVTQGGSKVLMLKPLDKSVAQALPAPAAPAPASPAPANAAPTNPPTAVASNAPTPQPAPEPAPQKADDKTPPGPRSHGPPQGLAGVNLTAQEVNDAIDHGARGLWDYTIKKCQKDRENFGDDMTHVLCALALVHADAHKKIPEFDAALRQFLNSVDPRKTSSRAVYRNALLCMLIQAYGDPTFQPKLSEAARWLLESEGADGTWTYDAQLPDAVFIQSLSSGALEMVGGEPPGQSGQDVWKRQTPWKEVGGDNSCTQFAILGLQAAAASGIKLPPEAWQRALDAARKRHCEDGGWDYGGPGTSYGSMTSAGICVAAIARYQTGLKKDFASDPMIDQAMGWLDRNMVWGKHPKHGNETDYVYYYTYSIERVGRILDTEFIGLHEWYPQGARWLVDHQQPNGLWAGLSGEEQEDPRLASSFSLLFLTRATPPLEPIVRTGPGMLRTQVIAPDNRFYIILDCSGSMIDTMDGQVKFDIARNAVRALVDKLPPTCQVALRVYGHRKTALDQGADLDTELKIPMGPLDKGKFNEALDSLRARGKTPLALSIEDAIQDLGSADKPVLLVLLTDGGEDTTNPRGKPLKAAEDLGKVKNVRFHIVGFDINQDDWSQQLQAMAEKAHGRYWPAARSADLQRSILNAVLGVPDQFAVLDAGGKQVAEGHFGDTKQLPSGKYIFRTQYAGQTFDQAFYISPGEQTAATFDATRVVPGAVTAAPSAAAAPAPSAASTPDDLLKRWPKFCTHCGAPLKPGQKFCTNCGQPVVVK